MLSRVCQEFMLTMGVLATESWVLARGAVPCLKALNSES